MIFVAYLIFLVAVVLALGRTALGRREPSVYKRGYGSFMRGIMLATSLIILLPGVVIAFSSESGYTDTKLLWISIALGALLYAAGAATWTGRTAFWLRSVGWILMAIPFLVPSTLTLALPLIAVLSFGLVPISSMRSSEEAHGRSAIA